jgi:D-amino peptidase
MRFFVSADIEGVVGVVTRDQGRPGGFEYELARSWMTEAVLTVCAAAREVGAKEVIVADSHGNGCNLQLERMPDYVQLVRSWPRPLGMMQGVEVGEYDGAFLIGYHAGSTSFGGVLAHTLSSDLFQEVILNGRAASEAAISAAIAGHFAVPVLMIAADNVCIAEAQAQLGNITGAAMKFAYGTTAALNPSLPVTAARLHEATLAAIADRELRRPYVLAGPVSVELRLRTRMVAEWLAYLPGVERTGAFGIRYQCEDILAASRFLMFVTFARSSLN